MSIIALAFTMCTPLICNTYLIDTSEDMSKTECHTQYVDHSMKFTLARNNGKLGDWAEGLTSLMQINLLAMYSIVLLFKMRSCHKPPTTIKPTVEWAFSRPYLAFVSP